MLYSVVSYRQCRKAEKVNVEDLELFRIVPTANCAKAVDIWLPATTIKFVPTTGTAQRNANQHQLKLRVVCDLFAVVWLDFSVDGIADCLAKY